MFERALIMTGFPTDCLWATGHQPRQADPTDRHRIDPFLFSQYGSPLQPNEPKLGTNPLIRRQKISKGAFAQAMKKCHGNFSKLDYRVMIRL
jgi:hypothetical protein